MRPIPVADNEIALDSNFWQSFTHSWNINNRIGFTGLAHPALSNPHYVFHVDKTGPLQISVSIILQDFCFTCCRLSEQWQSLTHYYTSFENHCTPWGRNLKICIIVQQWLGNLGYTAKLSKRHAYNQKWLQAVRTSEVGPAFLNHWRPSILSLRKSSMKMIALVYSIQAKEI